MKNKVPELYKQTCDEALKYLEYLARKAFQDDSRLTDFVCAMGSVTFRAKHNGIIDDSDVEKYPAIKDTFEFMDEWDEYLHLSGAGVWYKRDGSTLTEW